MGRQHRFRRAGLRRFRTRGIGQNRRVAEPIRSVPLILHHEKQYLCLRLLFSHRKDKNFDPNDTTKKSFVDIVDHDFIIDALAVSENDCTYVNLPSDNIRGTALDSVFKTVSALEADALDFSNNALLKTSLWATKTAGAKIYPAINRNPALDPSNPPAPGDLYWTAESNVASGLDVTAGGLVNSASSLLGCGRRP
jgi:hypothetical protein